MDTLTSTQQILVDNMFVDKESNFYSMPRRSGKTTVIKNAINSHFLNKFDVLCICSSGFEKQSLIDDLKAPESVMVKTIDELNKSDFNSQVIMIECCDGIQLFK